MPPRQVYGKKKAHVFASTTFLENPVKVRPDDALQDLTAKVSKLQVADAPQKSANCRIALCEVSDNENKTKISVNSAAIDILKNVDSIFVRESPEKPRLYAQPAELHDLKTNTSKVKGTIATAQDSVRRSSPCRKEKDKDERHKQTLLTDSFPRQPSTPDSQAWHDPMLSHLGPLTSLTKPKISSFQEFDATLSAHFRISKIAEASFSQVFLLSLPSSSSSARRRFPQPSVLKLIPLTPPSHLIPKRPSKLLASLLDVCSAPDNVASEVRLLQHLSPVPGFTNFRAVHLLRGRPGTSFCGAYKAWEVEQRSNGRETSHFPDPNRKSAYGEDQLWAAIEMQDAGMDLERLIETPKWHALGIAAVWDVFWQVVLACGKAELASRWEHRDLHLGNICVNIDRLHTPKSERLPVEGFRRNVGLTGLEVTVIDYTISRADIPPDLGTEEVAFIDLEEDQALFEGDGNIEYQYDIYRFMRSAVFLDDPLADAEARYEDIENSGRTWRGYHPQSNLVWLHFVLHQLLANHTRHRDDGVTTSGDIGPRSVDHEVTLKELNSLLKLENWSTSDLRSAGDLVTLAIKRGWLDTEDVDAMVEESKPRRRKPRTATKKSMD
ncbi:hypothetical protein ANO11243_004000 [Dothideomycetidae sp. 11243]|nr:hypothetical protein ANO11243_004000 [fungal sp. No.11243]